MSDTRRHAQPEVGEQRAWGWVEHLRGGGTTTWQDWRGTGRSQGRYLPGAQQLELLRRLNLAGRPSDELAAGVLTASSAGRGRPDLELTGVGGESSFGPAPVDPGDLPAGELLRVAASVLADQLVDGGVPEQPAPPRPSRFSRWRRGYRLVGDPELVDSVRAQLATRGRPPGGRQGPVLVLGADLATMTGHVWTRRAFEEGVNSWREWLRLLQERHELPARADLLSVCRAWEARVGKDRVHVVLDPGAVAPLTGERRPLTAPVSAPGEWGELARRVASVLGLLVLPEVRETLLTSRLRPRLTDASSLTGRGRPLVVPPAHRSWVEDAAERMLRGIRRAGYAVHGDLDALVPAWPGNVQPAHAGPSPDATLDLAIEVLLDPEVPDDRRTR